MNMILTYEQKLLVILMVDKLLPKFSHTIYRYDLKEIRNRYIYKDVTFNDFRKDFRTISLINKITLHNEKEKEERSNRHKNHTN